MSGPICISALAITPAEVADEMLIINALLRSTDTLAPQDLHVIKLAGPKNNFLNGVMHTSLHSGHAFLLI